MSVVCTALALIALYFGGMFILLRNVPTCRCGRQECGGGCIPPRRWLQRRPKGD